MKEGLKHAVAKSFDLTGLNVLLLRGQKVLCSPYVRALNYHDVPPSLAGAFADQLRFYARHFVPVGYEDLLALHRGRWDHDKPGLILTFDDGLRSHAEVVAPLLDEHGFVGWFMIPPGFVDTPPALQVAFARERQIDHAPSEFEGPRVAVTWDDVRSMDGRHVICCHTFGHYRLKASLTALELQREIQGAKRRMEEVLGHDVSAFAWVGGEEWSYSQAAARALRQAGFRAVFMGNSARIRPGASLHHLHRTHVEASFSPSLARLSLSGFFDIVHAAKRRRVERVTA